MKVLGLNIIREIYREERQSYKLDLAIGDDYVIELFSFSKSTEKDLPDQKVVVLRHLAFAVENVEEKRQNYYKRNRL